MTIDNEFFDNLLEKTKEQYSQTSIHGSGWKYSVCGTPLRKGRGLVFGLNWGGKETEAQKGIPTGEDIVTYNFISRSLPYLKKYLGVDDLSMINYSNLCFFRTPKISDITRKDIELSVPLFREYVEYIKPQWALFLSSNVSLLSWIKEWEIVQVKHAARTNSAYRSFYGGVIYYALPHPNARLRKETRDSLWTALFDK